MMVCAQLISAVRGTRGRDKAEEGVANITMIDRQERAAASDKLNPINVS